MIVWLKDRAVLVLWLAAILALDWGLSGIWNCHPTQPQQQQYCPEEYYGLFQGFAYRGLVGIFDWINRNHPLMTAAATAVIAWFTIVLASVGRKQAKLIADSYETNRLQMLESLNVARDTAEVAKKSADAAMGVELPRFVLTHASNGLMPPDPKIALRSFSVRVDVTNLGKTDAVVLADYLWVEVAAVPKKNTVHMSAFQRLGFRTIVGKDGKHLISRKCELNEDDVRAFLEDGEPVWLTGFITYVDFLNRTMKFGFAAALECPNGKPDWTLGPFVQINPKGFPYHEQIGGA